MKPVFAIMVTYKRFEQFKATLDSLVPTLPAQSFILIVDNHSDQQEYEDFWKKLRETDLYKDPDKPRTFGVIHSHENFGWGKAMNGALQRKPEWKDFEYILESNNDVTYEPDWCEKSQDLMEKYPEMGMLALWRHIHHGTLEDLGDILRRDNAPAVSWLFRSKDLQNFLPFPEHGPTKTSGGNGEDVAFTHRVMEKGFWIGSPKDDLSHHMDGYNLDLLGKDNPVYD